MNYLLTPTTKRIISGNISNHSAYTIYGVSEFWNIPLGVDSNANLWALNDRKNILLFG
jgi:hypothetical protein